ncbi:MAG: ATP-binding cassette domain-containing protein, partial [Cetobacterium sp.]
SNNITVIRRGADIANFSTEEATKEKIANAMVGRAVLFTTEKPDVKIGKTVLSIKNVGVKDYFGVIKVQGATFDIREGEVLGIAGVEGSGQTELIEALTGLKEIFSGEMVLDDIILKRKTPRKISLLGLAHIPEDRHKRAAVSQFSVMENFALGLERDEYSKFGFLNFLKLRKDAEFYMEKYDVRPRSVDTDFGRLSGGNQQKIIVARELEKKNNSLIIAGQPTRGVDIGAIESIHSLILNEKAKGKAVMVVSSELSEILNLSDKIAVMCAGKITGILSREEANEEKIGILMAGGKLD